MGSNKSTLVRLTESQQRFEVLWEKRLAGDLTLKELAEMDAIINRDPSVYQFVLKQLEDGGLPPHNREQNMIALPSVSPLKKLTAKLSSLLKRFGFFVVHQSSVAIN